MSSIFRFMNLFAVAVKDSYVPDNQQECLSASHKGAPSNQNMENITLFTLNSKQTDVIYHNNINLHIQLISGIPATIFSIHTGNMLIHSP